LILDSLASHKMIAFVVTLLALLFVCQLAHVSGHGVQIASCETESGYLRIFVEHWHGIYVVPSAITLIVTADGLSSSVTLPPNGLLVDTPLGSLPGCKAGTSAYVDSVCIEANDYNDWGFWDYEPNSCGQETTVQFYSGGPDYFERACVALYPTLLNTSYGFGCIVTPGR
jgi:hypothetical protein